MKNKKLKDLSIADLVALHTNFWLSRSSGARFHLVNEYQFDAIEKEIDIRMSEIDFEKQITNEK